MRKKRSTSSKSDHRGKKRYKREKDIIYKRREEEKPV
jgi:hypothetical protein